MIALIDLYRKELLKVNGFSPSTVETYLISIKAFCGFVIDELKKPLKQVNGPDLMKWLQCVKQTGIGSSRMEHHHYALKSFFGFLERSGHIRKSPADALPLLIHRKRNRTNCISTQDAFTLLGSFDRGAWHGLRDYTMVSLFWWIVWGRLTYLQLFFQKLKAVCLSYLFTNYTTDSINKIVPIRIIIKDLTTLDSP